MPVTGRLLARLAGQRGKPDLRDPATNARLGASYLSRLLASFGGDAAAALAAYNAGPGRVARWRREAAGLSSDEFLEAIPLTEPREYVKRVLFYEGAYAALYGIPSGPITRPGTVSPVPPL
jgi:soluble lytic murein transglycosylase